MTGRRSGVSFVATLLAVASLLVGACTQTPSGEQKSGSPVPQGQADPNGEILLNTGGEPVRLRGSHDL
jgi:hypothetical protein